MATDWVPKTYNFSVKLGIYLLVVSLVVGVIISVAPWLGIFLVGGTIALCVSWGILIRGGVWRRHGFLYVTLWLFSILSGNVYLLPLGSVNLWLSLSDFFLVFSLVVVIYEYRKINLRWSTLIIMVLMAFLVLGFFRGLMSAEPTRALSAVKAVAGGLLFFMIAVKMRLDDKALEKLFSVLYIWACCFLLLILYFILLTAKDYGIPIISVVLNKVAYLTPLGRTNYLASMALFLWPLVFFGTFSSGSHKMLGIIAVCALTAALLLLYSRGALITFGLTLPFMAGVCFYQVIHWPRRLPGIIILCIIAVLVVGGIVAVCRPWLEPIGEATWRLITSPSTWSEYSTAQDRFQLWRNALDAFVENPLLGQGLYNVTSVSSITGSILLVHNLPLQLLSETGIAGFSLYSFVLFIAAFRLLKNLSKYRSSPSRSALCVGMLSALFVSLINSMVEANFLTRDFDLLFWGILGIALNEQAAKLH